MILARMLAYITGTVDQELLLRNEYLAAENPLAAPSPARPIGPCVWRIAISPAATGHVTMFYKSSGHPFGVVV
jgi:hypothetical protein